MITSVDYAQMTCAEEGGFVWRKDLVVGHFYRVIKGQFRFGVFGVEDSDWGWEDEDHNEKEIVCNGTFSTFT